MESAKRKTHELRALPTAISNSSRSSSLPYHLINNSLREQPDIMYTRSLADRLKMKLEILTETFTDFIHRNSLRTPLMVMAGVAVIMTLKNGRQTIDMIKSMNRSPFSSKKASTGFYSPYGRTAGSTSYAPPAYASNSNQFGGASSRQYGTNYASSQMNSQYGQQQGQQPAYGGQMSQSNSAYGMNTGRYNAATPSYGAGNLRGTPATTAGSYPNTAGSYGGSSSTTAGTVSTTSLIAKYGASVQSVQPGLLHDFTSTSSFSGQIETLSAPDAPGFVEQTLRSPGAGKVLVIDGGGTMNALFDSNMAALAQQNGWKGVIINGFVLDPQALAMKQLGVKALGANPTRGMQMMGQRGVPISVAGVMFSPGSWVYADNVSLQSFQQSNQIIIIFTHHLLLISNLRLELLSVSKI